MTRALACDIDTLSFVGLDGSGLDWWVTEVKGWWTGPSVSVERTQRVVAHGEFAQRGHRGGRLVTISGRVSAPAGVDRALLAGAVDTLSALLADGGFGTLTVNGHNEGSRWTRVQLASEPDHDWTGGSFFNYQLGLLAPSPYKFGVTSSASTVFGTAPAGTGLVFPLFPSPGSLNFGVLAPSGILTLSNVGNADAPARFIVGGPTPAAGFRIVDLSTGKRITYLGACPTGSQLVLDGTDGSVVINGTASRAGDTIVEAWPIIPAGGSRDFLFEPVSGTSAAVLTAECVATYW